MALDRQECDACDDADTYRKALKQIAKFFSIRYLFKMKIKSP
jgi:hypothetical protein